MQSNEFKIPAFKVTPGPWTLERLALMSTRHYSVRCQTGEWLATVCGENNALAVVNLPMLLETLELIANGGYTLTTADMVRIATDALIEVHTSPAVMDANTGKQMISNCSV